MGFGNILKKIRTDKGLTQEELAKKINTSRSNIANYENEKNMPSIEVLEKLSSILNCSIDYLLGNTDDKKTNVSDKLFLIPILGRVPAGEPLLADENIEGYLPIDPSMYGIDRPDGFFFLVVQGESMNKVVTNGAYVLVRKQDFCDDNDVIVAIVNGDDEVTLKRFKDLGNGFIELKPESTFSEFSSRIVNTKDTSFKILGKVIGDFKKW